MTHRPTPVAITGVTAVSALGATVADHRLAFLSKASKLSRSHSWADTIPTVIGELPSAWLETRGLKSPRFSSLTRMQQACCYLIEDLLKQSMALKTYGPDRIGLSLGTTTAGIETWLSRIIHSGADWNRLDVKAWFGANEDGGTLAKVILSQFPFRGPDLTYSTACSSGALAVAQGFDMIQRGEVDACIVGGFDILSSLTIHGFHSLQLIDMEPCQPFAKNRKGMNLAEGGAFFLLEKSPSQKPLGFITGHGASTDFYHMTLPDPSGLPMLNSMRRAIAASGWDVNQVSYLNAHGTGTVANDQVEELAIRQLFDGVDNFKFESTKGQHGHCLGGAGALELLMAMIATEGLPEGTNSRALSNSFGFGGHNVTLAFSRQLDSRTRGAANDENKSTPLKVSQYAFHTQVSLGPNTHSEALHPLWRRMTWSCKSVLLAMAEFEKQVGCSLKALAGTAKMRVYYGTIFGEMDAALTVTQGILKAGEVISPTAFQQSVHNAPIAYFTQSLAADVPTVTITNGTGSFDRILWLASQDILEGICDVAVVISACENHVPPVAGSDAAFAELVLLTNKPGLVGSAPLWRLESMNWNYQRPSTESTKLFCEPLQLTFQTSSFMREVDCGADRSLTSFWIRQAPSFPIPAAHLLPHRNGILLVDTLDSMKPDGSGRVTARLRRDSLAFKDDLFLSHWLVEILAQAAGAVSRGNLPAEPQPPVGFLLSIDEFKYSSESTLPPDSIITVDVTPITVLPPLGKYLAVASFNGVEIGRATMKFYSNEHDPNAEPSSLGVSR